MTSTTPMEQAQDARRSLSIVRQRLAQAEAKFNRSPESVRLLAVSKTKPVADIQAVLAAGQRDFGENYLNEALQKIEQLTGQGCVWHFIGAIQSNKTKPIAQCFDWVHCVDRLKIAQRLSAQRECDEALNICVQVNIDSEDSKAGVLPDQALPLCRELATLPKLRLRGLMAIPRASDSFEEQRDSCRRLRVLFESIQSELPDIDTLSMGMSGDLEAAVAEGSTMVRVGTAIFGQRAPKLKG
ncbi:MAG: YggS family pyridoxal phosphate-dependent enzyme [Granulosicoccaceae bacterium]